MKKNLLYFALAVIIILAIIFVFQAKSYPIVSINETFVSAEYFQLALSSGASYYSKEPEIAKQLADPAFKEEFDTELRRATLEAIIKHEVIKQELAILLSAEEIIQKLAEKVAKVEEEKSATTDTAVEEIFGIDWETYKTLVIEPEAHREILEEEIVERNLDFETWLESKLEKADIEILLSGFYWLGTSVELSS